MEVKLNIPFEQLLQLVKQLPAEQLKQLKQLLKENKSNSIENVNGKNSFQEFLLEGPVFSAKQITDINNTHSKINNWRSK